MVSNVFDVSTAESIASSGAKLDVSPKAQSADRADANFFSAAIDEASGISNAKSAKPDPVGRSAADFLNDYQRASDRFHNGLLKVAKDPTLGNMMSSMHAVSDFDIRTRLTAKVVSSGVKGLDKLTSMQ